MTVPPYKRILLKLSGEALMGGSEYGLDTKTIARIAAELKAVVAQGIELCVVVGGGNIFRGAFGAAQGIERVTGDYMGMLATAINALALQSALQNVGVEARVLSAIEMSKIVEPFIRRRALRHLEKGRVVIFAAGSGDPYFSTDTAAALRASEMNCDAIFKGTKVDGVYSKDPKKFADAERFSKLTFMDLLSKDLKVMDGAAIALAKENDIPILVFSIEEENGLLSALKGEGRFTLISQV